MEYGCGDQHASSGGHGCAVPFGVGRCPPDERGRRRPQPDALLDARPNEAKIRQSGDRAAAVGHIGGGNLLDSLCPRRGIRGKQRQRIGDDGPHGIERHEPERDLAVRVRLLRLRRAREETDKRAGLGGVDVAPDPLVHRRPEPCIPAAIPHLQAEPVAVLAQAAVLLAQLGVIGRRVAEHAAAADPTEACERSLVVQDAGRRERCRDLLADDREEPLSEPMRLVAEVEHRLVERAALDAEGRR